MDLIPRPTSIELGTGRFVIDATTVIEVSDEAAAHAAALLRDLYATASGIRLAIEQPTSQPTRDNSRRPAATTSPVRPRIELAAGPADSLGDEGYRLEVTTSQVTVTAAAASGFAWAVQTIRQAMDPAIESNGTGATFALPVATIEDRPRWRWRGLMIDIVRHFHGPDELHRVIELMALYKLNVLHLHLTDDQGWRIEIDAYPELTAVGATTQVGGGPGGHLTQADYRSLVDHARRRGITVVPEIDMPGHTNAALASLPWLNCDGQARELYTGTAVGFSSLCIGDPRTDEFVRTVLDEIAAITPGPFIHLGGDESHATEPEQFASFIRSAVDMIQSTGKTPVAWDEASKAGLGEGSVIQFWFDPANAVSAAERGADIVLSPANRTYLDMKLDDSMDIGVDWAGTVGTRRAYEWDPATLVRDLPPDRIAGIEAPLWTETVTTSGELHRLLLPRLAGIGELAWSGSPSEWDDYSTRLAAHEPRWTASGRTFTRDPAVPWR